MNILDLVLIIIGALLILAAAFNVTTQRISLAWLGVFLLVLGALVIPALSAL